MIIGAITTKLKWPPSSKTECSKQPMSNRDKCNFNKTDIVCPAIFTVVMSEGKQDLSRKSSDYETLNRKIKMKITTKDMICLIYR